MQDQNQASAKVQPYLFFDGRCEEAIGFYKKALGAQVETMMRFRDNPDPQPGMCAPGNDDKIMHSCFRIGSTQIMASDGRAQGNPRVQGFALSVSAKDEADADRFGMGWMVLALPPEATGQSADFVISRVFDAPRELVWKAFTEPERMKQWWGPKGFEVIAAKMEFRPGGSFLYGMKAPDGTAMWGKMAYREISPPERMVFINSFSDEAGGTTRHPLNQSWPLRMLTVITFEEQPGGKTKFTVRWSPHDATVEERKTFDTSHDSMRQGWGGTMDKLAEYLANKA